MAFGRAGQPLIRLGQIDQRLGKADLILAREAHDLGVLAGGGDQIAGQGQSAQTGGALHLVIDLDRDARLQSGGLGFNLGLGHGGLLQRHHIRQNAVLFMVNGGANLTCAEAG